jgi:hypothetical protein
MALPLATIRQNLAQIMGEAVTGTPDSNLATGTLGNAPLGVYPDDYFNDWFGRFYEGTHKDTSFVVTDFAKSSGVVSFDPDLGTAVNASDKFELRPNRATEELNTLINLSISMVEREALEDVVDETIILQSAVFEYDIPTGMEYIDRVYQETDTANKYDPSLNEIDYKHWRILHSAAPKLWFDSNYVALTADRNLRLVGQKKPVQLTTDAATTSINQTFLVYQSKALLHQSLIRGSGADFEEDERQMILAQSLAENERRSLLVAGRGRKVLY